MSLMGRMISLRSFSWLRQPAHRPCGLAVLIPKGMAVRPKEILVVFQQLLEARPGDAHQLDFHFARAAARFDVPEAMLPSMIFCLPDRAD